MALSRPGLLLLFSLTAATTAFAQQPEAPFRHGVALSGELKYPPDFKHFDYVNPEAPKGGELRLSQEGTFDTFNPLLDKGEAAPGLGLVFDTLMTSADDEISVSYGLLAEGVSYPEDVSSATFRLRKEAKWADGEPVKPEDVVFSFEKGKELNPLYVNYYNHVVSAEKTGERDVTFRFDQKNNHELPGILGQLIIVPKHWWEGKAANGAQRDIGKTTLEPVMGSGPYKIASFRPGSDVRYELRDDYWGKDLNVNVGHNNIGTISYAMFADGSAQFEAFRGGNVDYWFETTAARWATAYDFPAIKDGRIKREEVPNPYRATGIMQAFVPNLRRDMFKDQRVREALNYALDFEELNRTLYYGSYKRVDSFFWNTELASKGLPEGKELELLTELKDKVPPEVFTTPYTNPVSGAPGKIRDNLRKAVALLKEAGWEIRGSQMVNVKTGQPMRFEILLKGPHLEPTTVSYANMLRKIGIEATVRTVDAAQYGNRRRTFDYDMVWEIWAQSLNPGNEQRDYWGSKSAGQEGSQNYAGISDPGVDALVEKVIFAKDRESLEVATRALDRVLMAHHYVIPLFYGNTARLAYSNKLDHPDELPTYATGFPSIWWVKPDGQ